MPENALAPPSTPSATAAPPRSTPSPSKSPGSRSAPARSSPPPASTPSPSLSPYDELDNLQREAEQSVQKETPPKEKKPATTKPTPPEIKRTAVTPTQTTPPKEGATSADVPEDQKPWEREGAVPKEWASELRESYSKAKSRVKELETQLAKGGSNNGDNPEVKTLSERLEQMEKDRESLEARIRMSSYEHSQEYKDKFETPIKRAFEAAYTEIGQLQVIDGESTRIAEPKDFNALVQMPLAQAVQAARAFGEAAGEVLAHRRNILQLNQSRQQALADAHSRQEDMVRAQAAAMTQQRQWWTEANKEAETKYPQWSQASADDPRESQILENSTRVADMAFSDTAQLNPKERVQLHSAIRNKARWFDLLAYRNQQLNEKLKTLESELEEFRNSTPGEGTGHRDKVEDGTMGWENELERLDTP